VLIYISFSILLLTISFIFTYFLFYVFQVTGVFLFYPCIYDVLQIPVHMRG
jgi:hypothetical protein